jgi:hypothetical protein
VFFCPGWLAFCILIFFEEQIFKNNFLGLALQTLPSNLALGRVALSDLWDVLQNGELWKNYESPRLFFYKKGSTYSVVKAINMFSISTDKN